MNTPNNQNQNPDQNQDQQKQQRLQEQQQQLQGGGGANLSAVKEHMEVVGSDGAHVGTVDRVEGNRIKLTKRDGAGVGATDDKHRYIEASSVASIEGNKVRLSTKGGDVAGNG